MFGQRLDTSAATSYSQDRIHTMYKDSSCSPHSYNMSNTSPGSASSQIDQDGGSPMLDEANDDLDSQHRKRYGRPPGAKDKKPRRRRTKAQMEEDALLYGIKTEEEPWQSPSLKRRRLSRTTSLGDIHAYNRSPIYNKLTPNNFSTVNGPLPVTGHASQAFPGHNLMRINLFHHQHHQSPSRAYSIVSPLTTLPGDWHQNKHHEVDFVQRSAEVHASSRNLGPFSDPYVVPFHAGNLRHRQSISPTSSMFRSIGDDRNSQRSSYARSESGTSFASTRRDSGSEGSIMTSPIDRHGKLSVPNDIKHDNNYKRDHRYSESKSTFGSQSSSSSVGSQLHLQLPQIVQTSRKTIPSLKDILNDIDAPTSNKYDEVDARNQESCRRMEFEQDRSRQNYNQSNRPDIRRLVSG